MLTKEQAEKAQTFHYEQGRKGNCHIELGPKGGLTLHTVSCRRSGATKTWKRSPERFRIPVKYGLYESTYVTEENADSWHTPHNCPAEETEYEFSRMSAEERAEKYQFYRDNPAERPAHIWLK